ncbi:restriction endonuclease subunit S [Streptomyces antimycoticus]|uniref:restriction endonuclease subunit S n=1 Tax=Streptomyces antimycoticus TaxID=68175 RepID=UPI0036B92960
MSERGPWRTAKLREIAAIYSGGTPSRDTPAFWGGNIPWLTPGEFSGVERSVTTQTQEFLTSAGLRSSGAALMPPGSLLVTTRATLGACTIAGVPMATNQGFKNLIFNTQVANPQFYLHVIRGLKRELERRASGTTFQEISGREFGDIDVPVPPLVEQQRIVDIIKTADEQLSADLQILHKEKLLQDAVFNDQLTVHLQQYEQAPLRDISREGGGQYGSSTAAVTFDSRLPRYVRITDINDQGCLLSDPSSAASIPWEQAQRHLLSEGDLLLARTGFTTGKSYLYHPDDGVCAYAGYLVRFRIDASILLPTYAFIWCNSKFFKKWVAQNIREVGQRNISAREYNEHQIPIPPMEDQLRLVRAWNAARSKSRLREQGIWRSKMVKLALTDGLLRGDAHNEGST